MTPQPQEYETQITAWFFADNAEDAVAIAARLADRVRNPPPNVQVASVITRPLGGQGDS